MSEIQNFRDLEAWQRGIELVLIAYELADRLPSTEKYELARQIRRAATSVPANVAEGHERRGRGYLHHVRIALGSLSELHTHVEIAVRLKYLTANDVASFLQKGTSTTQLLHGLRRALRRKLLAKAAATTMCLILMALAL